jgi:hypothetical protein
VPGAAVTQQNGTYSFQGLSYGNYELTITKEGFDSAVFEAIQVETRRASLRSMRSLRWGPRSRR